MKDLRGPVLSLLAIGALMSASAGTAWATDGLTTESCASDGSADKGDNAHDTDTDKDHSGANGALDEAQGQNGNADKGAENANNQCGENETGAVTNVAAGVGTTGEAEQSGNHDDGNTDR